VGVVSKFLLDLEKGALGRCKVIIEISKRYVRDVLCFRRIDLTLQGFSNAKRFDTKKTPQTMFYFGWYYSYSVISLAKNPIFHSRCKHIQLRYYFIGDLINDED
jgi:hypothetical protein